MLTDLYVPRQSVLHRLSAGLKLLALMVVSTALFVWTSIPLVVLAGLMAAGLCHVAHVPVGLLWRALRPVLWIIGLIFVLQWLWVGVGSAFIVAGRLGVLVVLATLVTMTTKVSEMRAAIERALVFVQPWGVQPQAVSLALTLSIRFIPLVMVRAQEAIQAQQARGARGWRDYTLAPFVVTTLKLADDITAALEARGEGGSSPSSGVHSGRRE